ncbi:MAG: arginase family protein [archaeon]|nr:MAG: arginase family protein [archaeon]
MTDLLFASKSFVPEYPLAEADVCFLGVPFDSTASSVGNQRFGPVLVRQALKNMITYMPGRKRNPFREKKVCDLGDVDVVFGDYGETARRIKDTVKSIRNANAGVFPVFIGGEHLATLPIVEALKPRTIVQLDAHRDLVSGSGYAHNTWVYFAANRGFNLVQIGVRCWQEEEGRWCKKFRVKKDLKEIKDPVYITIDMDVFDPAYAPDTGFQEPGGLSPKDVFKIIDRVFMHKVVGMDVMEIASDRFNNPTSSLAARVILRALSNL